MQAKTVFKSRNRVEKGTVDKREQNLDYSRAKDGKEREREEVGDVGKEWDFEWRGREVRQRRGYGDVSRGARRKRQQQYWTCSVVVVAVVVVVVAKVQCVRRPIVVPNVEVVEGAAAALTLNQIPG
mgnify:FL=1